LPVAFVELPFAASKRTSCVLKMGTVALDGTKIHANASRHSAVSYEYAGKIEGIVPVDVELEEAALLALSR
jgi:formate hydrogenlyase subunit 4